ncbi:MAG TPA: 3'-5' exonuclease [Gemmataceae bacterium]|nr:3'-5' exonuclease [Gemmataceae bacterium]
MLSSNGLHTRAIADQPVAVIDFETTGMFPGNDRVVEVSVVRVEPGREPELVFDTLINPNRRMDCTYVHGITDHDVIDAPRFEQVACRFLKAIAGCVVAAYNVSFDMRFLNFELSRVCVEHSFPHLCLMYLRPMLGLGRQCKLADACWAHGVPLSNAHAAGPDALAAAGLWSVYRDEIASRNIRTFAELAAVKRYKFTGSFDCEPHPGFHGEGPATARLKSRNDTMARSNSGPLVSCHSRG